MESAILVHFTPKGETVNSQKYHDVLRTKLNPKIRSKHYGKLRKDAISLRDNVRPHTANLTVETVSQLGFELMEHPPYSPDLSPSDFSMFGPMKEALRGRIFSSYEEIIGAVQNWLKTHPKNLFSDGIKKNLWNARTDAFKLRGITLKSYTSFVSVYL
jgi:histone-lysine N-methyltransferase SETMAR